MIQLVPFSDRAPRRFNWHHNRSESSGPLCLARRKSAGGQRHETTRARHRTLNLVEVSQIGLDSDLRQPYPRHRRPLRERTAPLVLHLAMYDERLHRSIARLLNNWCRLGHVRLAETSFHALL